MLLKNFKIEDDSIRSARRILLFCHFHFFFFFFLCLNSKSLFQSCNWNLTTKTPLAEPPPLPLQFTNGFLAQLTSVFDLSAACQSLSDPNSDPPSIPAESLLEVMDLSINSYPQNFTEDARRMHGRAVIDRVNEVFEELHELKHCKVVPPLGTPLNKLLLAQSLPLNETEVFKFIKRSVVLSTFSSKSSDTVLDGGTAASVVDATIVDGLKEQIQGQLKAACADIADEILYSLLDKAGRDFEDASQIDPDGNTRV